MLETARPHPAGSDEDNSHMLLIIIWVEASLGIIVMIARLFTRTYISRNLGWDDFWMVVTWLCAIIADIIDTVGLHYGIARHKNSLSPENASKAIEMDWSAHGFAITALGLGKVSFAIFLMRIVPKTKKWMIRFLHGYNALLIAINIPLIVITYAQCDPVAGLWDPTIEAKCWPPHIQASYAVFQGSYGALADLVLALFPIVILWNLNMTRRSKFGLASLMGLGVFSAGCAAVKIAYLPLMTARADFTWETQYMIIWFTTEMYCILIAATVPTLRPLFQWLTNQTFRSSLRNNKYQNCDQQKYALSTLHRQAGTQRNRDPLDAALKSDADSDRSILGPGNIQKTTDIDVAFDDVSSKKEKAMHWSLP